MKRIRYNQWLGRKLWGMNKKLDEMSKQLKAMQFIDNLEREERHKRAMSQLERLHTRASRTFRKLPPFAPNVSGAFPWKPGNLKPYGK